MKDFCKKLNSWLTLFLQSFVSFLSVCLFSSFKASREVSKLGKIPKDKDCMILGNGPSLTTFLLKGGELMRRYDCVVVNLFCNNDIFFQIRPKYYVLTDPVFFDTCPKSERISVLQTQLLEGVNKVEWDMTLFIPSIVKKSSLINKIVKSNIHIVFYNYTPIKGFMTLNNWLFKYNLGMPLAMNVLCASIFLMINCGYKNIYLLGADHNWIASFSVNDNNELISIDKHFYGTKEIKVNSTMAEEMSYLYECFHSHEQLNIYSKYRGVKVYNSTKGSFIDCYERKYLFD